MPLPIPNTGESETDFISRCMSNETALEDFPEQSQRSAVCFSQWRKKDSDNASSNALVTALVSASPEIKARFAEIADLEADLRKEREDLLQQVLATQNPAEKDRTLASLVNAGAISVNQMKNLRKAPIIRNDCRLLVPHQDSESLKAESSRFEIKDLADGNRAEIVIYSDIGEGFFGGFSAENFSELLDKAKGRDIDLRINSYGGDVFQGTAMYNRLLQYEGYVTAYIDGIAASIASVIPLAANEVVAFETSTMMIHLPWAYAEGNEDDLEALIKRLELVKNQLLSVYSKKSGYPEEEILEMMREETFFDAQTALEMGFVDRIESGQADDSLAASADRDWIQHNSTYIAAKTFSHRIARLDARLKQISRGVAAQ